MALVIGRKNVLGHWVIEIKSEDMKKRCHRWTSSMDVIVKFQFQSHFQGHQV